MPGSAKLRLTAIEDLFVAGAAFCAKVNLTGDAARAKVFFSEMQLEQLLAQGATLAQVRPGVVLCVERHGYQQIGQGTQNILGGSGSILAVFCDNPTTPDDPKASYLDFVDWTSQVIDEIAAAAGLNTNWPIGHIELVVEHWRPDLAARQSDDFWLCAYAFSDHINEG